MKMETGYAKTLRLQPITYPKQSEHHFRQPLLENAELIPFSQFTLLVVDVAVEVEVAREEVVAVVVDAVEVAVEDQKEETSSMAWT